MNEPSRIKELQAQIEQLSAQLQDCHQKLLALHRELKQLQKSAEPDKVSVPHVTSKNHRFENFVGLRVIHLVGIVVLVIGLCIGVKYAIDRRLISETARIILAYAAGIILYILSRRLKKNYHLFSAILFSGAMASLYFTTYAAFVYYGFLSFTISFLMMISFTVYTALESLRYNRQEIAVLGMVGAYGIPFLISANSGRADLFFSYIMLINLGVVYLSFKKKWITMSQIALLISWTLFISWAMFKYKTNDFWIGLVFLTLFYLLFIVNSLSKKMARSEFLNARDIQLLVLNNLGVYLSALIVFGGGKLGNHGAAITGWACVLLFIASILAYLFLSSETSFHQSMFIQSVILLFFFIAFNWSGLTVTLLWAVSALALFIIGLYAHRYWPRLAAIVLMGVVLGKLVIFDSARFTTVQKIIAYIIIGSLLLMLSFLYQKFRLSLFGDRDSKIEG